MYHCCNLVTVEPVIAVYKSKKNENTVVSLAKGCLVRDGQFGCLC